MVPKRKSEEQDDYAVGMGDSKKKKPKGPGIALVIAIGHKGKHDKDAMKKAWAVLKGDRFPFKLRMRTPDEFVQQHGHKYPDRRTALQAYRAIAEHKNLQHGAAEHEHLMAEEDADLQSRAEEFAPPPPYKTKPFNINEATSLEELQAHSPRFGIGTGDASFAPPPPPKPLPPEHQGTFSPDYDSRDKEKDAGF